MLESDVLLYKIMSIQLIFVYETVTIELFFFLQFIGLEPGDDGEFGDTIQTRTLFTADDEEVDEIKQTIQLTEDVLSGDPN